MYNYHSAKLTFGLILLEFNDAIKEGDGDRLFDIYKMALLLYKAHGHFKYAHVVLLHLVKWKSRLLVLNGTGFSMEVVDKVPISPWI